jgi:hypothetical protein
MTLRSVMLSEAKHPHTGFLAEARNDTKKRSGMNKKSMRHGRKKHLEYKRQVWNNAAKLTLHLSALPKSRRASFGISAAALP